MMSLLRVCVTRLHGQSLVDHGPVSTVTLCIPLRTPGSPKRLCVVWLTPESAPRRLSEISETPSAA